ncbi:MAG: hypothetical protein Q4D19_11440, partial [Lautropia sp.]|nr:hypothetical protein [Lautropia sp.]
MKPTTSIRRRLIVYLGGGLLGFWLLAVGVFVGGATHEINEMADIQMTQVARTLMHVTRPASATDTETSTGTDTSRGDGISRGSVPDLAELLPGEHLLHEAGDSGFAVWNEQGKLLLADAGGQHIPWQDQQGFTNTGPFWEEGAWRIVRLKD